MTAAAQHSTPDRWSTWELRHQDRYIQLTDSASAMPLTATIMNDQARLWWHSVNHSRSSKLWQWIMMPSNDTNQQQKTGRVADPAPHAGIGYRPLKADQVKIHGTGNGIGLLRGVSSADLSAWWTQPGRVWHALKPPWCGVRWVIKSIELAKVAPDRKSLPRA